MRVIYGLRVADSLSDALLATESGRLQCEYCGEGADVALGEPVNCRPAA